MMDLRACGLKGERTRGSQHQRTQFNASVTLQPGRADLIFIPLYGNQHFL